MFEKSEVNGENEIPIYTFLKATCGPTFTQFSKSTALFYEPLRTGDIAWNFEKFLIDRDGHPVRRYHPHLVNPEDIDLVSDIEFVLAKPSSVQRSMIQPITLELLSQTRQNRNVGLEWDILQTPQM